MLRQRLNERYAFRHPENAAIDRLTHILWTGAPKNAAADARNAVFYGDKAIDRSPCGTGTSARMAQLHAKGRLRAGDSFVHESIIGSLFTGRVESETSLAGRPAIVPSIGGWARMTGFNTIIIDDRPDPYARTARVEVCCILAPDGSLTAVTLPRRGPGYELSYPSGNECWIDVSGEQHCAITRSTASSDGPNG